MQVWPQLPHLNAVVLWDGHLKYPLNRVYEVRQPSYQHHIHGDVHIPKKAEGSPLPLPLPFPLCMQWDNFLAKGLAVGLDAITEEMQKQEVVHCTVLSCTVSASLWVHSQQLDTSLCTV